MVVIDDSIESLQPPPLICMVVSQLGGQNFHQNGYPANAIKFASRFDESSEIAEKITNYRIISLACLLIVSNLCVDIIVLHSHLGYLHRAQSRHRQQAA